MNIRELFIALGFACIIGVGLAPRIADAEDRATDRPKIGVAMASFDDNFLILLREAASREARQRGWKPVFVDARGDAKLQTTEIAKLVTEEHVAALVVRPVDSNATAEATEIARRAGVPVVYFNLRPVEPMGRGAAYVGSDNLEAGRLQGEYVVQRLNGKGNIAIMVGPAGSEDAVQRTLGVKRAIARVTGMHVVAEEVGNWRRDLGLDIMKRWLAEQKDIQAVVANNDEMAIGAVIALRKAGKDPRSLLIVGVDATPDALAQMDKGAIGATVLQDAKGQGGGAVDLAIRMKSGDAGVPDNVDVPFKLVTPDNYKAFLDY
ncbi:sugar ABC transporter substrate-binding protein [Trinickia terrae]|uniref:Sugar ABC transporter substrate-binding protein n=1 Tax=Trinickia terrae TaxID=2571161 RepID=A0A4U1IEZ3_9BURK|nr:substrate-binding domain-containing protein [Trinickia terrae]TKC92284.1 sugar ABC transporter substrate-binding protein [Trinickia terrae]